MTFTDVISIVSLIGLGAILLTRSERYRYLRQYVWTTVAVLAFVLLIIGVLVLTTK